MGEQAPFYIFTAFVFSYGVGHAAASIRDFLLTAVLAASALSFVSDAAVRPPVGSLRPASASTSGRGPHGACMDSSICAARHDPARSGVSAIVLSLIPHDIMYGPQAALIAESFPASCDTAARRLDISCRP